MFISLGEVFLWAWDIPELQSLTRTLLGTHLLYSLVIVVLLQRRMFGKELFKEMFVLFYG